MCWYCYQWALALIIAANLVGSIMGENSIPVKVTFGGTRQKFYFQFCGAKGDWPFLRSAYRLASGYSSTRKCHLCDVSDS